MYRRLDSNLDFLKRQRAYENGVEEGSKEQKLEMAKKLKEKGMDIEEIVEITDLTKEEIENL
jgi:predicted transposase/invertase (TIGR01784 family)